MDNRKDFTTAGFFLWVLSLLVIACFLGFCSESKADEKALFAKTDGATIVLTSEPCAVEIKDYEFRAYAFATGFPNLEGCYQDEAEFMNVNIRFLSEQVEHETTRSYGKQHFQPFLDSVEARK